MSILEKISRSIFAQREERYRTNLDEASYYLFFLQPIYELVQHIERTLVVNDLVIEIQDHFDGSEFTDMRGESFYIAWDHGRYAIKLTATEDTGLGVNIHFRIGSKQTCVFVPYSHNFRVQLKEKITDILFFLQTVQSSDVRE